MHRQGEVAMRQGQVLCTGTSRRTTAPAQALEAEQRWSEERPGVTASQKQYKANKPGKNNYRLVQLKSKTNYRLVQWKPKTSIGQTKSS